MIEVTTIHDSSAVASIGGDSARWVGPLVFKQRPHEWVLVTYWLTRLDPWQSDNKCYPRSGRSGPVRTSSDRDEFAGLVCFGKGDLWQAEAVTVNAREVCKHML